MHVVMYMAITLNGYIARLDGTEEFLAHENWDSMVELASKYKNLIVGRKTYEINQKWPGTSNLRSLEGIKKIVVSGNPYFKISNDFRLVNSPEAALRKLKGEPVACLIGGGTLNAAFATKKLIDEIVINIDPTIIGKGRQVFAPTDFDLRLELTSHQNITPNLIQLHYDVIK